MLSEDEFRVDRRAYQGLSNYARHRYESPSAAMPADQAWANLVADTARHDGIPYGSTTDVLVRRAEIGSPETDALNQSILLREWLRSPKPGSEGFRRVSASLGTYTRHTAPPSPADPRQQAAAAAAETGHAQRSTPQRPAVDDEVEPQAAVGQAPRSPDRLVDTLDSGPQPARSADPGGDAEAPAEVLPPANDPTRTATAVSTTRPVPKGIAFLDEPRSTLQAAPAGAEPVTGTPHPGNAVRPQGSTPLDPALVDPALVGPEPLHPALVDPVTVPDDVPDDVRAAPTESSSTASRFAALLGRVDPEYHLAMRRLDDPLPTEMTRWDAEIHTRGGGRSIVFGEPEEEPVWLVKTVKGLEWFTQDLVPLPKGPVFAWGPVASIDISYNGQLTGPAAQALKNSGEDLARPVKQGFCDTNFGYGFANLFHEPVPW